MISLEANQGIDHMNDERDNGKNDWQQAFIFVLFGLIFFCEFFVGIRNFRQYVLLAKMLHSMS